MLQIVLLIFILAAAASAQPSNKTATVFNVQGELRAGGSAILKFDVARSHASSDGCEVAGLCTAILQGTDTGQSYALGSSAINVPCAIGYMAVTVPIGIGVPAEYHFRVLALGLSTASGHRQATSKIISHVFRVLAANADEAAEEERKGAAVFTDIDERTELLAGLEFAFDLDAARLLSPGPPSGRQSSSDGAAGDIVCYMTLERRDDARVFSDFSVFALGPSFNCRTTNPRPTGKIPPCAPPGLYRIRVVAFEEDDVQRARPVATAASTSFRVKQM